MEKTLFVEEIKKIVDSVKMPIILYDRDGDINLFVNRSFLEEIGYTTEDIPGIEQWLTKAYPDENYRDEVRLKWRKSIADALLQGEQHARVSAKTYCKNGIYKWFEVHRNVIGPIDVITCNNVDDLYKQNEQLASYNEQIKMLLSIISHDVRSPLGILKNLVDNFTLLELSTEEMKDMFSAIGKEIDNTFQLINTALLWISSKNESFSFHAEAINLHQFFSGIKENSLPACKEKGIALNIDPEKDTNITFDVFILEVVARNIINNAIKFCLINGTISVTWSQSANYTDIYIKDDGPGMSKEKIDNILLNKEEPGKQKDLNRGFGIGLKLINQCLRKYQGEMMIESAINKGTKVTVRIPGSVTLLVP